MHRQFRRSLRDQWQGKILKRKTDHESFVSVNDFFNGVKKEVFEIMDNSIGEFIPKRSSKEIAEDMLSNTTGDFHKVGVRVLCRYIDEWKELYLTNKE